jgi:hypothetical protein
MHGCLSKLLCRRAKRLPMHGSFKAPKGLQVPWPRYQESLQAPRAGDFISPFRDCHCQGTKGHFLSFRYLMKTFKTCFFWSHFSYQDQSEYVLIHLPERRRSLTHSCWRLRVSYFFCIQRVRLGGWFSIHFQSAKFDHNCFGIHITHRIAEFWILFLLQNYLWKTRTNKKSKFTPAKNA